MDVLKKVPVREQDPKVRATNFDEVCLGYNAEEAVEEADEADEHHVAFILDAEGVHVVHVVFLGHGDDADAFRVVFVGDFLGA